MEYCLIIHLHAFIYTWSKDGNEDVCCWLEGSSQVQQQTWNITTKTDVFFDSSSGKFFMIYLCTRKNNHQKWCYSEKKLNSVQFGEDI